MNRSSSEGVGSTPSARATDEVQLAGTAEQERFIVRKQAGYVVEIDGCKAEAAG